NNTTVGTTPIRLRSPDLLPLALSTSPSSAQFGQSIPLSWVITNAGSGEALASWNDRIYLGTTSNSLSGATLLAPVLETSVPLTEGAAISNSASFTLPLSSASTAGTYYLLVSADDGN